MLRIGTAPQPDEGDLEIKFASRSKGNFTVCIFLVTNIPQIDSQTQSVKRALAKGKEKGDRKLVVSAVTHRCIRSQFFGVLQTHKSQY